MSIQKPAGSDPKFLPGQLRQEQPPTKTAQTSPPSAEKGGASASGAAESAARTTAEAVSAATTAAREASPPGATAARAAAAVEGVDQFEEAPGASFTNQLLGLDRNADGALSREELSAGTETLERLVTDGREVDRAEKRVFDLLCEAQSQPGEQVPVEYAIREGRLQLQIGQGEGATQLDWAHTSDNQDGLPQVLMEAPGATVVHGTDPGDFYCEHMFFSAQQAASAPESSVLTNNAGEKMVGFLHVPADDFTRQAEETGYTQAERHGGTRQVMGAALRGFYEESAPQIEEGPMRVLLTGYDQFQSVRNNPTGDFVAHRENLDASMAEAFGEDLLTSEGELVAGEEPLEVGGGTQTWRYQVRDAESGETRDVEVTLALYPVEDQAIDPGGDKSIQNHIAATSPHAVLSMGVAGEGNYRAEHRADSGGLLRTDEGVAHDYSAEDTVRLRDNYSLARAIEAGASFSP